MTLNNALENLRVLITRPQHQAVGLKQALESLSAKASILPCIEILSPKDARPLNKALRELDHFDIAIFLSANAVTQAATHWRPDLNITTIAIGPATEKALLKRNIKVDYLPQEYCSDGLISLSILQDIAAKKIVIFCGENPKPLLYDTLTFRGANVTSAYCYRRMMPTIDPVATMYVLKKANINLIISTSKESLQNLYDMLSEKGRDWLLSTPLLVISQEMLELARELKFHAGINVAKNATDEAIVAELKNQC